MHDDKNLFADLEGDFDAAPVVDKPSQHTAAVPEVTLFSEPCPKCRGTGAWRTGYRCFKCKGAGKLEFKTSPEMRARGRKGAAKSKAKKATEALTKWGDWMNAHPEIRDWLLANSDNTFAQSLHTGGMKYGHLTEGQEQAVYKAIARDEDGAADFKAYCSDHEGVYDWLESEVANGNTFAGSLMDAGVRWGKLSPAQLGAVQKNIAESLSSDGEPETDIDLTDLLKGFYAVPDGETRLKIAVRRPGKNSRWFGWTFVDDGAAYGSRRTYGKQGPDGLYKGGIKDELRAVLADPKGAMIAYGRLTGTCGACGRILEDEDSINAGIGPVCAAKM